MNLVLYNSLGFFTLCAITCLTIPMMVLGALPSYSTLAWVVGCALFLLDIGCRVRLYWVAQASQDKVLSFLSATAGGQLLCLPLWLWGCVIIAAMLLQSPILVVFAISLTLADIVYRLRRASLAAHAPMAALVHGPVMLPPLWLLGVLLLMIATWRSPHLEDAGWPSTQQMVIYVLLSFVALRLIYKRLAGKDMASEATLQIASPSQYERRSSSRWQHMRQHFPWRQCALGALIPMFIFYLFSRFERPLLGAVFAGSWGFGVMLVGYWRSRRIDLFAGMAMAMAVIELLVITITRNPAWYLASEAIQSAAYSVLCLGSLAFSRSLIQLFAEEMGASTSIPDDLRRSLAYRTAWHLLSGVWGGASLLKAGLLLLAQWGLALEAFLIIRALSGFPLLAGLLAFSFWFPGWYWRRTAYSR